MTAERKAQLIAKARKVFKGKTLEGYIEFINNFEEESEKNDQKIMKQYPNNNS